MNLSREELVYLALVLLLSLLSRDSVNAGKLIVVRPQSRALHVDKAAQQIV